MSRHDDDFIYHEPILFPDENAPLKMAKDKPKSQQPKAENVLKVYPNPAKAYFIIEYQFADKLSNAMLEITDAMGHKIESIAISKQQDQLMINTDKLSSGLYYCRIMNNNKQCGFVKITVKK